MIDGRIGGGKAIYGAPLGILMLEARFPRIPGDMGNAVTWPFPVLYRVVRGASPDRVVRRRAEGLLPAFIEAGRELTAMGAAGITTNCGFLCLFQGELATALGVPVLTSSLLQYRLIARMLPPERRVGILTVSRSSLTADHLAAAEVPVDAPIEGPDEGGEFARTILGNRPEMDPAAAERDLRAAAARLVDRHPEVGAILLECTNMGPFAAAIAARTGRPVFDMVGLVTWFHGALAPRRFPPPDPGLAAAVHGC